MRDCRCDDGAIARYDAKLSGPLLDRVDIHVAVRPVPWRELDRPAGPLGETSAAVRARVERARRVQHDRGERLGMAARTSAQLPVESLDDAVDATAPSRRLLGRAVERLGLSARAAHRTLRVARTIADLGGKSRVEPEAMAEAVGLRASGAVDG